jgi:hypothetical protein
MSIEEMDMSRDIPEDLKENMEASLEYMSIVVGRICMPEDEKEEEECLPYEDPEGTCDSLATALCLNTNEFSAAVLVAQRDNMFDKVCQ